MLTLAQHRLAVVAFNHRNERRFQRDRDSSQHRFDGRSRGHPGQYGERDVVLAQFRELTFSFVSQTGLHDQPRQLRRYPKHGVDRFHQDGHCVSHRCIACVCSTSGSLTLRRAVCSAGQSETVTIPVTSSQLAVWTLRQAFVRSLSFGQRLICERRLFPLVTNGSSSPVTSPSLWARARRCT